MRNLKNRSSSELLQSIVLGSAHVRGKDHFNWIDVTYRTLCDLGVARPYDDYKPDIKNIDKQDAKDFTRWLKIKGYYKEGEE